MRSKSPVPKTRPSLPEKYTFSPSKTLERPISVLDRYKVKDEGTSDRCLSAGVENDQAEKKKNKVEDADVHGGHTEKDAREVSPAESSSSNVSLKTQRIPPQGCNNVSCKDLEVFYLINVFSYFYLMLCIFF